MVIGQKSLLCFWIGTTLNLLRIGTHCTRPEADLQARYLVVSGSHVETIANISQTDITRPSQAQSNAATTTEVSPESSKPHACEEHFAEASNWRFSITFGQEMKRGVGAEMEEKDKPTEREPDHSSSHKAHELERIRRVAIAFRGSADVVERRNRGIYVRPSVDAWTLYSMKRKFGCTFKGEVRLSLSSACEDYGTNEVKSHAYHEEDHESTAFRLSAPRRMRVASLSATKKVNVNQASEMRLVFCVKPGSHWEWMPLAMFWYFRDADGKSARSLWQDANGEVQASPAVKDWSPKAADKVNLPLADEKEYLECNSKRWGRFDDTEKELLQAVHESQTLAYKDERTDSVWNNIRQAQRENLKAAKAALAGTPCEERDTQGLQEHSSIAILFLRSQQPQHQETAVKVEQVSAAATGKGPGVRHKVNA